MTIPSMFHIEDCGLSPADQFKVVGDDTPLPRGDYSNLE